MKSREIVNPTSRVTWLEGFGRLVPGEPTTVPDTPAVDDLITAGGARASTGRRPAAPPHEPHAAPRPDKETD
jgi:hypothetical protein